MTTHSTNAPEQLVERSVLSEQVKDRLLKRIVEGDLEPGSRIVETRVAREFGISQAPVREALRSLASLGLVEMRPHRGASVRKPSREELVEAVQVRGVLEAFAAEQAALKISDEHLEKLELLLEEMLDCAASGNAPEQTHKNAEFHATVVSAAGHETLERTWKLLEPFSQTYLTTTVPGVDLTWLAKRHVEILDALKAHDPEAASSAMRQHLDEAAEIRGRLAAADERTERDAIE
ncbi:MAG: GntR family transcriptional regulator [Acidimicrobiia bacterium]